MAPLTGPVAPEGKAMQQGFTLAVDEINAAGGVNGHPIAVATEDTKGTPSNATTAARKLIQQEKVGLLFGTILGDASIPVNKLATQAKVPLIKTIKDDYLHSPLCSEYFFKLGESDYQLLSPMLPFMIKKYGKRVALVGDDYSFPHAYNKTATSILKKSGGTVVAEEYAPLGTSDWSSVIGKLRAANPSFVLASVVGGDAIAFLKQGKKLGLLDKHTPVTGTPLQQEFYPAVPNIVDGLYYPLRYSDQIDTPANKKFVAAFRKRYKGDAPIAAVTANSYTAVHFIAKAVKSSGGASADDIVKGLRGAKLSDSVYGKKPISFDPKNNVLVTDIYLSRLEAGGKYTIVKDWGAISDPTKC